MKQSKDLFKGWPQTKVNERNETITVTPKYTSPGVVGLRKKLIIITCIVWIFLFMGKTNLIREGTSTGVVIALIIILVVLCLLSRWVFNILFNTKSVIKFSPDGISIKNGRFGRSRQYDGSMAHGFNMEIHEKADEEQDSRTTDRLYRDSFHVFMDHVEGRIYIADIYKIRKAETLVTRLQGVDQYIYVVREERLQAKPGENNVKEPGGFD